MSMWLCRAGSSGEFENKFLEENRIYCTWDNLSESILQFKTKQDLQQYFLENEPDVKVRTAMNWASQVWPFGHEMKRGEIVVLPSKIKQVIHFGKITGDYAFLLENGSPYYHVHSVDWFARDIPRSNFDQDILYSFGAFMTICRIKQEERVKAVIHAYLHGKKAPLLSPPQSSDEAEMTRDIENEALDAIKNLMIQKAKGQRSWTRSCAPRGSLPMSARLAQTKGWTSWPPLEPWGSAVLKSACRSSLPMPLWIGRSWISWVA